MASPVPQLPPGGGFPLRPFASNDRRPKTLAEFLNRMNVERGGFRNITVEGLLEEDRLLREQRRRERDGEDMDIAMGDDNENGNGASRDGESSSDEGDDEDEGMDVYEAKQQMINLLEYVWPPTVAQAAVDSLLKNSSLPWAFFAHSPLVSPHPPGDPHRDRHLDRHR
jgi:hypothetical protein